MKFKQYSDTDKKQMALDYEAGDSLKQLAARFGVSIPTMAKYVRAGGGNVRKPGTVRNGNGDFVKTVEAVNDMLAAQVDLAEVVVSEPVAAPVRVLLPLD